MQPSSRMTRPGTEPDEAMLKGAIQHLARSGDIVGIVRLAERWAEQGALPRDVCIAEARAFLDLRLMDRAWVRLREVSQADPNDIEALLLTARMFIERGWPARARRVLERARQVASTAQKDGSDSYASQIAEMERRANGPPLQPPPNARELERTGAPRQLLDLAERYLATGSFLRAKSILERLRRAQPGNQRVLDLLWGVRGEFVNERQSLAELVAELTPDIDPQQWDAESTEGQRRLGDLAAADPPTAEVTKAGIRIEGERDGGAAFPNLFRREAHHANGPAGEAADEVTVSSRMASLAEMLDAPPEGDSGSGSPQALGPSDTRIMEVISSKGAVADAKGPVHTRRDDEDDRRLRETLDLRRYQERMGVKAPETEPGSGGERETDDPFLEDEDQDLVVMTRREEAPEAPRSKGQRRGRIEVIEKHPVPEVPPQAEGSATHEPDSSLDDEADLRSAFHQGRRVVLLVAAMVVGMALLAWGAFVVLRSIAARQVIEEAHRAVAAGDYRGLLEQEGQQNLQVQQGTPPVAARETALALIEAVLWSDYTGDVGQRDRARALVAEAKKKGASRKELALVDGVLALAAGDVSSAQAASKAAGTDTWAGIDLAARVNLAAGHPDAALRLLQQAPPPRGVRQALLFPVALAAAGKVDAAKAAGLKLLASAADNPLVVVTAHEQAWQAMAPEQRLGALAALVRKSASDMPPRLVGRIYALRARLYTELEKAGAAEGAWKRALAMDSTNADYLYRGAIRSMASGRELVALDMLGRCLDVRPFDRACQRADVAVLLDLDRVIPARKAVEDWAAKGVNTTVLDAWVKVAEGHAKEAVAVLSPAVSREEGPEVGSGLAWFVLGNALGVTGEEGAARALDRAHQLLQATGDPLDAILAVRALGAEVEYGSRSTAADRIRLLGEAGNRDPIVEVHLARYYNTIGRPAKAAEHFDRAVAVGPENAVALYERGLFYFDPQGRMEWALEAWRRYLDLGPSGPRAERTKERLGVH